MISLSDSRLAQRLAAHEALVVTSKADAYPAYPKGDRRKRPLCWVSKDSFTTLSSFGALERQGGGYGVTQSFSKRCKVGGNFANQHRDIEERDLFIPPGVKRLARVNRSLSALDRLYRRKDRHGETLISKAEYEAGRRYAADYALAGYNSLTSQNFISTGVDKMPYTERNTDVWNRQIDARMRLEKADEIVGRGLKKALIPVCCMDISLSDVERSEKWAVSTGLTILKMALSALAEHYGTQAGRAS